MRYCLLTVGTEAVGRLPDGTDLSAWRHVAIQVHTVGLASLWIGREQVATLRVPTTLLREALRVAIFGDLIDTRACVRNFGWRAEPPYRWRPVGAAPDPRSLSGGAAGWRSGDPLRFSPGPTAPCAAYGGWARYRRWSGADARSAT